MSITTGWIVSLAKTFPFLRSSRLRFGCGLVLCSSASSLGVGVGVVWVADDGATGRVEERRLGGEAAGWPLQSSSHVDVVSSSSRRLFGLVVGAGSVCGGNNIVKYYWMMGLSFFPLWKA